MIINYAQPHGKSYAPSADFRAPPRPPLFSQQPLNYKAVVSKLKRETYKKGNSIDPFETQNTPSLQTSLAPLYHPKGFFSFFLFSSSWNGQSHYETDMYLDITFFFFLNLDLFGSLPTSHIMSTDGCVFNLSIVHT